MNRDTVLLSIIKQLLASLDSYDRRALLERILDKDPEAVARALGIDIPAPVPAASTNASPAWAHEVVAFLRDGHKVSAIKAVRTATGMGLKEAKDAIDYFTGYEGTTYRTLCDKGQTAVDSLCVAAGASFIK